MIDLLSEGQTIDWKTLEQMHLGKTSSLIIASLEFGGIISCLSSHDLSHLRKAGSAIGIAFQLIDDVLNYVPARLTALSYALFGRTRAALACWRRQAPVWESPNAGPVMSAGAGSIGLALGGPAVYHGQIEERPVLGAGRAARGEDIPRALSLVRRGIALWLAVFLAIGVLGA